MNNPVNKEWITSREAAKLMNVKVEYLHRLVYMNVLTAVKVGHACLFRKRDIERYIETHPRLGKRTQTAA